MKTTHVRDARDDDARARSYGLPSGRDELLSYALDTIHILDRAVMADDTAAANEAMKEYEAICWKLNGGTFFGCATPDPESANSLLNAYCRAADGTTPLWGQPGDFIVTVRDIPVRVTVSYNIGMDRAHFEFRAVEPRLPFLSETGYRSHFGNLQSAHNVSDSVASIIDALLEESTTTVIPTSTTTLQRLPAWITDQLDTSDGELTFTNSEGQHTFVF